MYVFAMSLSFLLFFYQYSNERSLIIIFNLIIIIFDILYAQFSEHTKDRCLNFKKNKQFVLIYLMHLHRR